MALSEKRGNFFDFSVLENENWYYDFQLKFEDDGFIWKANRVLFASKSNYFREKLTNNDVVTFENREFMKNKESTMKIVTQYFMFQHFDFDINAMEDVLRFSKAIDQKDLFKDCIKFMKNHVNEKYFAKIWDIANIFKIESLRELSKIFIIQNFEKIYDKDFVLKLNVEFIEEVLRSKKLNINKEEEVFLFIKKWLEYDANGRMKHYETFINFIRFKNISEEFIIKHIDPFCDKFKLPNVKRFLKYIDSYPRKRPLSLEQIAEQFHEVIRKNEFFELPVNDLCHILKLCDKKRMSPKLLYLYLEKWIDYDDEDRREHFPRLLEKYDWEYLPIEFVLEKVNESQLNNENQFLFDMLKKYMMKITTMDPKGLDVKTYEKSLLVVGGEETKSAGIIEIFNDKKNVWENFCEVTTELRLFSTIILSNSLILFGGQGDKVLSFDLETKKITSLPRLKEGRSDFTATVIDGSVYVCGGNLSKSLEMWTPGWENWKNCQQMSIGRGYHAAVQWKNRLYVFGGYSSKGPTNSVEFYDLKRDEWNTVLSMKYQSYGLTAVVLNDLIYVMGGHDGKERLNSVNMYDPQSDLWTALFNLPEPLSCLPSTTMYGKIFISGGLNANRTKNKTVYEFDPKTGIWEKHSELINERYYHAMLTIPKIHPNT